MQRRWFQLAPVDGTFFDTAPACMAAAFEIARPAQEVWAELTGDRALAWCRILQRVAWTSPAPHGVGTTRTVWALAGTNVMRERFFRWEDGRHKSFHVVESSTPLFRRFAEDYLVEPVGDGACRFTWTVAYEPRGLARLGTPLNDRLLGSMFTDTRRHFGAR